MAKTLVSPPQTRRWTRLEYERLVELVAALRRALGDDWQIDSQLPRDPCA